jgi:hypothetical protein
VVFSLPPVIVMYGLVLYFYASLANCVFVFASLSVCRCALILHTFVVALQALLKMFNAIFSVWL